MNYNNLTSEEQEVGCNEKAHKWAKKNGIPKEQARKAFVEHILFDIRHYENDGFVKIADVELSTGGAKWSLINQHSHLYSTHNSWVYCIVDGSEIVKLGETGQPLGIRTTKGVHKGQPMLTTKCRFGRLRGMGTPSDDSTDTDRRIRFQLHESARNKTVSLYAKKCKQRTLTEIINGCQEKITLSSHKELEKKYLNQMERMVGRLPKLNKGKA